MKSKSSAAAEAGMYHWIDVAIVAGKDCMAAWLYSTTTKYTSPNPGLAPVLAHGLGVTKELKLDVYASKFHQLG